VEGAEDMAAEAVAEGEGSTERHYTERLSDVAPPLTNEVVMNSVR